MTAEIVNLRTARKRSQRGKDEKAANAQRVAHGSLKALRQEIKAVRDKASRDLDGHRRDPSEE